MPDIPAGYGPSIIVLAVYFAAVTFVGLYAWRKFPQSDPESYILGGRAIGWLVAMFTLMATQYSALTVLGFPGTMYRDGLAGYVAICGMYIGFAALYWMAFAARTWKLGRAFGHMTPGETFSHFYGSAWVGYLLGGMLILAVIPYIQVQILGLGFLFKTATGGMIDEATAAVLVYFLIIVYTLLGGMRAVALTDTLQGVLLVAGLVGGAAVVVHVAGGIPATFSHVIASRPELLTIPGPPDPDGRSPWPWPYLISFAIPVGLGWTMHPHMWIRMHIPKTVNYIRLWPLIVVASFPIVMGAAFFSGIAGQVLRPGETNRQATDTMMISLILENFPPIVAGLVAAAGIAAMMSSVSSQIHGVGASFSRDYLHKLFPEHDPRRGVLYTRLSVLVVGAIGLYLSLTQPGFLTTLGTFSAAWGAQAAPAAIAALVGCRWATRWGAIAGTLGGSAVLLAIVATGVQHIAGLYAGAWGLAANVALFVGASLFTRSSRPDDGVVRAYRKVGW
ncbi:MAG: sodium:solute symporter family protein [Planctomycetaceae bacterium]